MSIEQRYIRTEGVFKKTEIVDFPNYFLDVLLKDSRMSAFITYAKLEGGREYRKSGEAIHDETEKSKWESIPFSPGHGYCGWILLENLPFLGIVIKVGKSDWIPHAHVMYSTSPLKEGSFGNVIFNVKRGGFLGSGNPVDIDIKGDDRRVAGLADIRKDQDLIKKIRLLLMSGMVAYKDYKDDQRVERIEFSVISNPFGWITGEKERYGAIQTGLRTDLKTIIKSGQDYPMLCKASFETAVSIAEYLRPMWSDQ